MKKAQIETIGLLIIIILLVTLAAIFISLYLKKPATLAETRTSAKLTTFLNTITKISLNNKKLADLTYDCYSGDCATLQQELTTLTTEFFKQSFSYTFKADNKGFFTINTCNLGLTANYQFIKNNINFLITLKLC